MLNTDDQEKQERFALQKPISYGSDENGDYQMIPLSMVLGGELKPFKVYIKPMKHIINTSNPNPRGWYKPKHPETDRIRPRPCASEAVLTVPYGGYCPVSCCFCYVDNGTRGYRATRLPTVSPTYPDHMRKQIQKMMIAPAFYISSFTEPFQLLEDTYEIVRRLTDILVENGLPLFYLSRKIPPDWAVDALQQNPYSYMQWSINSSNTKIYKKLSPGSYTIEEVMDKIKELHYKNIYVSIQCNPVLPGIVDLDDIVRLVHLISENGGDHVIFKFAEQVTANKKLLMERLRQAKVIGVDKFESLMNQIIGGVYTIQQDVRLEWLNVLLEETRKAGITMGTCYEYYDNGHAGANLGPWFLTSRGGCHGQTVPMFYRPAPGEPFQPLPGCFESGCLYCEEFGTKACKNARLLEADMLTFKDYKDIKLNGNTSDWKLLKSAPSPNKIYRYDYWYPDKMTFAEYYNMEL